MTKLNIIRYKKIYEVLIILALTPQSPEGEAYLLSSVRVLPFRGVRGVRERHIWF